MRPIYKTSIKTDVGVRFSPVLADIYNRRGGGKYRSLGKYLGEDVLVDIETGWAFYAKDVVRYADGSIDWSAEYGGHYLSV